jgi:hypothetical protein
MAHLVLHLGVLTSQAAQVGYWFYFKLLNFEPYSSSVGALCGRV